MEKDTMVDPVLVDDFTARDEPLALFQEWYESATLSEPGDPNAMSLATVDPSGMPNVRMVLVKDLDHRGLTFYT
ncbi:MAG: pyridoxamine 5'-phosphate oxidase family protein, partial [Aestuariivirgaceae bacterium]